MPKRPGRDMMVGSVFAFAMLILALAIMSVGGESELWTPTVGYGAIFPNTDGLRVGSPVKLAGVRVGWVHGVHLCNRAERTHHFSRAPEHFGSFRHRQMTLGK